jgi:hypothetical protein
MAHNLGRAIGQLAGPDLHTATAATLRRRVFTMPGRLGAQRQTPATTTTDVLAMGSRHQHRAEPHHRHSATLLTTTPATTTRTLEKPADRQHPHAPTPPTTSLTDCRDQRTTGPRSTVDPGLSPDPPMVISRMPDDFVGC